MAARLRAFLQGECSTPAVPPDERVDLVIGLRSRGKRPVADAASSGEETRVAKRCGGGRAGEGGGAGRGGGGSGGLRAAKRARRIAVERARAERVKRAREEAAE